MNLTTKSKAIAQYETSNLCIVLNPLNPIYTIYTIY